MIPERVIFHGFEVEHPAHVVSKHPSNLPAFWPIGWAIVPEPKGDTKYVFRWLSRNCISRWDIATDPLGNRVFAFESEDEAALFTLSF